jgi:Ser/Thr protein kinase RdoA (MazF antagonist)
MPADEPLRLLAAGRDADVFALDERRVLRRYRDGSDVAEEAAMMAYLAERGVPVPTVYEVNGADLVMERLAGPTLLDSLVGGGTDPAVAAGVLADLHQRLHAVPTRRTANPSDRILHLDLHPGNVMLAATEPVLIDWRNTAEGPPDLDLAVTALIIAEVATGSFLAGFGETARQILTTFLRLAGGDPRSQLDHAVAYRSSMPTLSRDEKARLAAAADLVVTSAPAPSS